MSQGADGPTGSERSGPDGELYLRLREQDFTGPEQEAFEATLAGYAWPVLLKWIHRRTIFEKCAELNRFIGPTDAEARDLASDLDGSEREGLAGETIALALAFFRKYALRGGSWRPDGGASLRSYFIDACVRQFPTTFRRWRSGRRQPPTTSYGIDITAAGLDRPTRDAADAVIDEITRRQELESMPPRIRAIAQGIVDGKNQQQIGKELGKTARAVEGELYRYRRGQGGEEGR